MELLTLGPSAALHQGPESRSQATVRIGGNHNLWSSSGLPFGNQQLDQILRHIQHDVMAAGQAVHGPTWICRQADEANSLNALHARRYALR